ncbi:MAG: alpha/beta hydrolase [Bacteroidetes bacterium]|nr:alpha/beta hydrolase [Bacteroidota bacterium]MBL6962613.1 alpha/beta hydrolase [Bacteroidota bacterium]
MERKAPEIFFIDDGSGDAIVFLHGFLENHEIWDKFTDKLSSKYRIISMDLPGHGRSSVLSDNQSMELIAAEVKTILEILGIHKCLLIGHSMGGYAAIEFASKFSRLLKGLILLHSHVEADSDEDKINRDRTIEIVQKDHLNFISQFIVQLFAASNVEKYKKEIEYLKRIAMNTSRQGVIASLQGMRDRNDHLDTLVKLRIPVLLIAGDQDSRIPIDKVKKQAQAAPKVRLEILEGTGHMGFIEAEGDCFKLIRDFAEVIFKKSKPH